MCCTFEAKMFDNEFYFFSILKHWGFPGFVNANFLKYHVKKLERNVKILIIEYGYLIFM